MKFLTLQTIYIEQRTKERSLSQSSFYYIHHPNEPLKFPELCLFRTIWNSVYLIRVRFNNRNFKWHGYGTAALLLLS